MDINGDQQVMLDIYILRNSCSMLQVVEAVPSWNREHLDVYQIVAGKRIYIVILIVPNTSSFFHDWKQK